MNKNRIRRVVASSLACLAVSALFVFGSEAPASACSCVDFESTAGTGDAVAVFVGNVIDENRLGKNGFGDVDIALLYEVESVYKGEIAERVTVLTTDAVGGGCGLGFRGRTAVLAYIDEGALVTSSCSAMPLLDDADATLTMLAVTFGPAEPPSPAAEGPANGPPVGLLVGVGVFAGLLLVGILFMVRSRDAT